MDKVQFNTEVVNMRKVVKRVKVLVTHSLTRHITKLRNKKGSEQQTLKNKRRAERFVAEIEAMKDLTPDTVTKKAVTISKTLQEVLNNPKSSAKDRMLARIIFHKLTQERVTQFKDMVTKDFLRTGSKKYRRLRKGKFESEAEARLKAEEDYQVTLERMMSADKLDDDNDGEEYSQKFARKMETFAEMDHRDDGGNLDDGNEDDEDEDEDDGEDDGEEDEFSEKLLKKIRTVDKIDQDDVDDNEYSDKIARTLRTSNRILKLVNQDDDSKNDDNMDVTHDDSYSLEKMMIQKMMHRDAASSDDDVSIGSEDGGRVTQQRDQFEPLVGTEERLKDAQRILEDAVPSEESHSETIEKRKLDSMFLGNLSSLQNDDITKMLQTTTNKPTKQKNKPKLPQKQQPQARQAQEPAKKARLRVPMVDQPNIRHTPGERLIPGINCHPDLPPRHAPRETHETTFGKKPFRPLSKQLPAHSRHHGATHPAAATVLSQKKPTAKESLHPSWEASKKRKAESKIVPFQGKKITFDED